MKVYVDAKELLAAAKFAENKKNKGFREILRTVHVESFNDGYSLVATDSYKLVVFTNKKGEQANEEFSCNIGIDVIKDSIKTSDDFVKLQYDSETNDITFDIYKKNLAHRATITAKANDGNYPNYKKLLDDAKNSNDECSHIKLNSTILSSACAVVEQAYGKETPIDFDLHKADKPVLFNSIKEYVDNAHTIPIVYCDGIIYAYAI